MLKYKIRELRRERGLTQIEFGKLINISASTIALWETGKREPDIKKLKEIANIFNVTTDYLLDNEKENLVDLDIDVNKKNLKMNIIEMIGRNGDRKTFIVDDLKMNEIELIARNLKKVDKNQRL